MREIKFRAWDVLEEEFVSINHIGVFEDGSVWYVQAVDENEREIDPPYFVDDSSDIALMQYTGLKDKNGIEIYEGDILQIRHYKGKVVFEKGGYFYRSVTDSDWNTVLMFEPDKNDQVSYEVVGNIYENPELLEVD